MEYEGKCALCRNASFFDSVCVGSCGRLSFYHAEKGERRNSASRETGKGDAYHADEYLSGPFYGYVIHYPSFFEQVSNPQVKEKGYCQFRFWNVEQIVQTAFVLPNLDSLTVVQGMSRFARELHATYQREEGDCFILSGPLHLENREVVGHRFYAKYVQCQKLWFVQILTYPENCAQAVTRLIREIDRWKVWEKKREKKLPESFDSEPQTISPYEGPCFPWILITN